MFTEQDRAVLIETSKSLSRLPSHGKVKLEADTGNADCRTFVLPTAAVRLLTDMLMHLGNGRGVEIMPSDAELTTQAAADVLNVSRPYLIRLLEAGKIPFHMAGTHRRIWLTDLSAYRISRDDRSRRTLEDLAQDAQELGLGY